MALQRRRPDLAHALDQRDLRVGDWRHGVVAGVVVFDPARAGVERVGLDLQRVDGGAQAQQLGVRTGGCRKRLAPVRQHDGAGEGCAGQGGEDRAADELAARGRGHCPACAERGRGLSSHDPRFLRVAVRPDAGATTFPSGRSRVITKTMTQATGDNTKTRRPDQAGVLIGVRLQPEQLARLDAWISPHQGQCLSRPEAIRRLIEFGLEAAKQQTL